MHKTLVSANTAVIIGAKRTPISTRGGRLAKVPVENLAAAVISAVSAEAQKSLEVQGAGVAIGGVYLGNCMGPGGNLGRVSALAAGLPLSVPAMTIDTQCGSSLSAIMTAASAIESGLIPSGQLAIAGGAESASTAPTRSIDGVAYSRAPFAPAGFPDPDMGPAAQALAVKHNIARPIQDAYAVRSHDLASAFGAKGGFEPEIAMLPELEADDAPREGMSAMVERFTGLYPDLAPAEVAVTGGNSSRNSDGAAAVALISNAARSAGQPGLAIVGMVSIGVNPELPGIGPVAAVTELLNQSGLTMADITAFEMVEAFAAQTLSVLLGLGLAQIDTDQPNQLTVDPRVCANGGALALGHPWGASAAVSVVRLFSRLVRGGAPAGSLGIATVAVGGGMGMAVLVEVVR
ncbi:thiolase family protein [Rhodoluna sp. KAS3]|uniref:thiolase family protein n=1 Tax=Rhodoluna sp. KAS3 TaxID=942880 RepID=UPI00222E5832|nr:thiolase family protein [Rhodoluna sp. KAS3]BDS48477.1 putative acetyl-CoA C-acetyltransferase YhfS [Rhodoluna sp. KAS3]